MRKWIIFDVMGVIFKVGDDVGDLLIPFIRKRNKYITTSLINTLYTQASLGSISPKDLWEQLGLREEYPLIEQTYLNECLTFNEQFDDVASNLGKKYNLAMLSNDIGEWSAYLRVKHNLNDFFQEIVVSGNVGYRKPSKEIYELILDRTGANPSDCVFIDDNIKNLIPAADIGIKTILFNANSIEQYNGVQIASLHQLEKALFKVFK